VHFSIENISKKCSFLKHVSASFAEEDYFKRFLSDKQVVSPFVAIPRFGARIAGFLEKGFLVCLMRRLEENKEGNFAPIIHDRVHLFHLSELDQVFGPYASSKPYQQVLARFFNFMLTRWFERDILGQINYEGCKLSASLLTRRQLQYPPEVRGLDYADHAAEELGALRA